MSPSSEDLDSLSGAGYGALLVSPRDHSRTSPFTAAHTLPPAELAELRPVSKFIDSRTEALRQRAAEELTQLLSEDAPDHAAKDSPAPVVLAAGLPTAVKLSPQRAPSLMIPFVALQPPPYRPIEHKPSTVAEMIGHNDPAPVAAQIELGTYFPEAGVFKLREITASGSVEPVAIDPRCRLISALRWMALMERIHHLSPDVERQITEHIFSATPPPWRLAQISPETVEDVWRRPTPCLEEALHICGRHGAIVSLEALYVSICDGTVPYTERLRSALFLQEQSQLNPRVLAPWVIDARQILSQRTWYGLRAYSVNGARQSFPFVERALTTLALGMARLGMREGDQTTPLDRLHNLTSVLCGEVTALEGGAVVRSIRALSSRADAIQDTLQSTTQSLNKLKLLQASPPANLRDLFFRATEALVDIELRLVDANRGAVELYKAIAREADVESTAEQAWHTASLSRATLRVTRKIFNERLPGVMLSRDGARCEKLNLLSD